MKGGTFSRTTANDEDEVFRRKSRRLAPMILAPPQIVGADDAPRTPDEIREEYRQMQDALTNARVELKARETRSADFVRRLSASVSLEDSLATLGNMRREGSITTEELFYMQGALRVQVERVEWAQSHALRNQPTIDKAWRAVLDAPMLHVFVDEARGGVRNGREVSCRFIVARAKLALATYVCVPGDHPLIYEAERVRAELRCHGGCTAMGHGEPGFAVPRGWYGWGWDYAHAGDATEIAEFEGDTRWPVDMARSDANEPISQFLTFVAKAEVAAETRRKTERKTRPSATGGLG